MLGKPIMAVINGQTYQLHWDMGAMFALEDVFGITMSGLRKIYVDLENTSKEERESGAALKVELELSLKLLFCMTRTSRVHAGAEPPSFEEVLATTIPELLAARLLLPEVVARDMAGLPGKAAADAAMPAPESDRAPSGIGASPSGRQSAAAASRRKSFGR